MKGRAICDLGAGPAPGAGFTGATGYVLCPCMLGVNPSVCLPFLLLRRTENRKSRWSRHTLAGADKPERSPASPAPPSQVPRWSRGEDSEEKTTVGQTAPALGPSGSGLDLQQKPPRKTRTS